MLKNIYSIGFTYPKTVISIIAALTIFFALQLDGLRWETDARVYLPKGHDAILYDEKVDEMFGVKDSLIISIVNEVDSVYNTETLERIERISKKVAELPGVIAINDTDVASLSTATVFEGDDTSMGSRLVMPQLPKTADEIERLKQTIQKHKDILVGNIVSADGTAAMIRLKIKEGAQHRYMTYFQVKGILALEKGENPTAGPWDDGEDSGKWGGNEWVNSDGTPKDDADKKENENESKTDVDQPWEGNKWVSAEGAPKETTQKIEKEEKHWNGNEWVNNDGSKAKSEVENETNWAGNKWVKTDGMPKAVAAATAAPEEADWQGNKWLNPDGAAKTDPNLADPDFGGNKWVKTDGSLKPAASKTAIEEADWQGNKWVSADGELSIDLSADAKVDPDFGGNKWVKADGSTKPAAQVAEIQEESWQGNQWVTPDGSSKVDPEIETTDFAGNKWVQADGSVKPTVEKKEIEEAGWQGNKWVDSDGSAKPATDVDETKAEAAPVIAKAVNDVFHISGRPAIEVSSGLYAMEDMQLMVPTLIAAMALVLLIIFRTWRGMLLPIAVMTIAITWTFGLMVVLDVPLYTISTMLPVILVAVGIGDGVHLISAYYDKVLHNPQADAKTVVSEATLELGPPLIMTSLTTAIGFLALMFAEMPPFKIFGVFAMVGILFSWIISISLLPAVLSLLKPKVGNYLAKRRALRVYSEQDRLSLFLTGTGRWIEAHRKGVFAALSILVIVALFGASKLHVDSSWMSDFREDTDISQANDVLNDKFSGSIFLNVVIEAAEKDAFKNPALLEKMEALQLHVKTLPYVGDSISVVDYIKSMNRVLHSDDERYNVLPDTQAQIAEYLFVFSVSGRPQQLDEVVDFAYQTGLVTVIIKTDHTKDLKHIIDSINAFVDTEFKDLDVDVNLSGSGNNSYVWADLLIDSQSTAIVLSKVVILVIAALVFMSFLAGIYVVIPVTLSTLFVAGAAGWLSIPLDVSTALAAGIAIGVGVDYAVHFIFRYVRERKLGLEHLNAMENTLRSTGHTIVLNAVVVTVGFSVLFFSQFPPHVKLGYFVTAYMIVSCIVAIWILPALISYFKPSFSRPNKT